MASARRRNASCKNNIVDTTIKVARTPLQTSECIDLLQNNAVRWRSWTTSDQVSLIVDTTFWPPLFLPRSIDGETVIGTRGKLVQYFRHTESNLVEDFWRFLYERLNEWPSKLGIFSFYYKRKTRKSFHKLFLYQQLNLFSVQLDFYKNTKACGWRTKFLRNSWCEAIHRLKLQEVIH